MSNTVSGASWQRRLQQHHIAPTPASHEADSSHELTTAWFQPPTDPQPVDLSPPTATYMDIAPPLPTNIPPTSLTLSQDDYISVIRTSPAHNADHFSTQQLQHFQHQLPSVHTSEDTPPAPCAELAADCISDMDLHSLTGTRHTQVSIATISRQIRPPSRTLLALIPSPIPNTNAPLLRKSTNSIRQQIGSHR